MVGLLAFVGLIWLLWYLSRVLNRASRWLTALSGEMADYVAAKKRVLKTEEIRQQNIKLSDQVSTIKGTSDASYSHQVKQEIDQLCEEIEG